MVALDPDALEPFPRFTLYNSPYVAHDDGRAVDLYPGTRVAPSPVAGEVLDVRTVRAPPKPYAPEHDHLVVVDCADRPEVARLLHVDPTVGPGDEVALGAPLGELIRAGFFAPWVDDHVHLEFRAPDANPYRATGSEPVSVDATVRPVDWDGTGTVVEVRDTYAVLDRPAHPDPGAYYVGVGADGGGDPPGALDGGLCHYGGGGLLGGATGPVALLGTRVGHAAGRTVAWDDVAVVVDGDRVTGLSLFLARDGDFGAKVICPDREFGVGDEVTVSIRPTSEPVVLG